MKYIVYLVRFVASFGYDLWYFFFGNVRSRIQGWSYYKASKQYPDYLKHGNMMVGVQPLAQQYCHGRGVDIGAGKWPFPGARAIEDSETEDAYHIKEVDSSLDFVFSSHTLEHLSDWKKAMHEWYRTLKPGGTLFLYVPHSACAMWEVKINPQHLWTPMTKEVVNFLQQELHMVIEYQTALPDGLLSFVVVAKK